MLSVGTARRSLQFWIGLFLIEPPGLARFQKSKAFPIKKKVLFFEKAARCCLRLYVLDDPQNITVGFEAPIQLPGDQLPDETASAVPVSDRPKVENKIRSIQLRRPLPYRIENGEPAFRLPDRLPVVEYDCRDFRRKPDRERARPVRPFRSPAAAAAGSPQKGKLLPFFPDRPPDFFFM